MTGKEKKAAYLYRKFPLITSWSTLANQCALVVPAIFIGAFYSVEAAGFYAMAQRLLAIPMDLIGQSVMSLYIGELSDYKRKSPEKMKSLFYSFFEQILSYASFLLQQIIALFDYTFLYLPLIFNWLLISALLVVVTKSVGVKMEAKKPTASANTRTTKNECGQPTMRRCNSWTNKLVA